MRDFRFSRRRVWDVAPFKLTSQKTLNGTVSSLFYFYVLEIVLGSVMVIVLAIAPKARGFKPGRERWIFKTEKNP
jgi:hypothetical protein